MTANLNILYIGTDLRGSTRVACDANGRPAAWFGYDPYGAALESQGGGDASVSGRLTRRYVGQVFEAQSGLYHYGARLCDTALARFVSADPLYETPAPYAYCGNDPVDHVDRDGRGRHLIVLYVLLNSGKAAVIAFSKQGAYVAHFINAANEGEHQRWMSFQLSWLVNQCRLAKLNSIATGKRLPANMYRLIAAISVNPKKTHRAAVTSLIRTLNGGHERFHLIMAGEENLTLVRYINRVGGELGQWSALSLTLDQINAAMALHEGEVSSRSKVRRRLLQALQPLREYAGVVYDDIELAYYAQIGKPHANPTYLESYRLASEAYDALKIEASAFKAKWGTLEPEWEWLPPDHKSKRKNERLVPSYHTTTTTTSVTSPANASSSDEEPPPLLDRWEVEAEKMSGQPGGKEKPTPPSSDDDSASL